MAIAGQKSKIWSLSIGPILAVSIAGGTLMSGCATGCLLAHGAPDETEDIRDVKLADNTYEIVLPYTELVKCVQHRVPPGGVAGNRANYLCPSGFKTLVDGQLRPSKGPAAEEFVWQIECTDN